VIGDTPSDIRAARQNGLTVIGVATGIYSLEQLSAERPDLCLQSLGELVSAAEALPA
jgi:phosphoglycolate phosphatase